MICVAEPIDRAPATRGIGSGLARAVDLTPPDLHDEVEFMALCAAPVPDIYGGRLTEGDNFEQIPRWMTDEPPLGDWLDVDVIGDFRDCPGRMIDLLRARADLGERPEWSRRRADEIEDCVALIRRTLHSNGQHVPEGAL